MLSTSGFVADIVFMLWAYGPYQARRYIQMKLAAMLQHQLDV